MERKRFLQIQNLLLVPDACDYQKIIEVDI